MADYDRTGRQEHPLPARAVPFGARPPACAKIRAARKRASRGSALLELALVMPILLLITTGIVTTSLALQNELALTNAVNLGAQAVASSRGQTSDPCATGYTAISAAAPGLVSGLSLTFVIDGNTYAKVTSCTAGASYMVQGTTVQITGTYPATLVLFWSSIASKITATTSEYIQ